MLLAVGVFVLTVWIAMALLQSSQISLAASVSTVILLLAVMVLLLAGALAHEMLYWRMPTARLKQLIDEVHRGARPVEDLSQANRGMTILVEPIQKMLGEMKALKAEIYEINGEMRQRIANRTDALERKLGAMAAKSSRDALTGVLNRRAFDEQMPRAIQSCRAIRQNLVLLIIDVDHFKVLNDTLGHQAGDDLLRSIGQIIRSTIRDTDQAFRYGGDEFVVLLPDADLASAKALGDRLRYLVDGLTKHVRNLNPRPQLSIGIASLQDDLRAGLADAELLAIADKRLYAIKNARPAAMRRTA